MGGPTVELERLLIRLVGDASGYTNMLNDVQKKTMTAANRLAEMGKMMTFSVTAPLVALGALSVREFMKFETAMARIEGLVKVPHDVVAGYSTEILKMAVELGVMPEKLAKAMYFITSSGIQGVNHLELLRVAAKASVAGLAEIDTIADVVTSAMSAYGSENLSAAQATDVLVAVVREGKAEGQELARTMGRILPLAAIIGLKFNELGAGIAGLTRIGGASVAITNMRQFLATLVGPTKEAEDALASFGLSAAGLRDQIKNEGLLATLVTLKERVGDNVESLDAVFGNIRALTGVLQLIGPNMDSNIALFRVMANTVGDAEDAFAVMARTVQFDWNRAVAAIKVSMIMLGEILSPVARWIAEIVRTGADWWRQLSSEGKKVVITIAIMVAAIGPLMLLLGAIGPVFIAGFGRLSQISARIVTLAAVFGRFGVLGTTIGLFRQFFFAITLIGSGVVFLISYFGGIGPALNVARNSGVWALDQLRTAFLILKVVVMHLPEMIAYVWGQLLTYTIPITHSVIALGRAFLDWLPGAISGWLELRYLLSGMLVSFMFIGKAVYLVGRAIIDAAKVGINVFRGWYQPLADAYTATREMALLLTGSLIGAIIGTAVVIKLLAIAIGLVSSVLAVFRIQQIATIIAVIALRVIIVSVHAAIMLWVVSLSTAKALIVTFNAMVTAFTGTIMFLRGVFFAFGLAMNLIHWGILSFTAALAVARLALAGVGMSTGVYTVVTYILAGAIMALGWAYTACTTILIWFRATVSFAAIATAIFNTVITTAEIIFAAFEAIVTATTAVVAFFSSGVAFATIATAIYNAVILSIVIAMEAFDIVVAAGQAVLALFSGSTVLAAIAAAIYEGAILGIVIIMEVYQAVMATASAVIGIFRSGIILATIATAIYHGAILTGVVIWEAYNAVVAAATAVINSFRAGTVLAAIATAIFEGVIGGALLVANLLQSAMLATTAVVNFFRTTTIFTTIATAAWSVVLGVVKVAIWLYKAAAAVASLLTLGLGAAMVVAAIAGGVWAGVLLIVKGVTWLVVAAFTTLPGILVITGIAIAGLIIVLTGLSVAISIVIAAIIVFWAVMSPTTLVAVVVGAVALGVAFLVIGPILWGVYRAGLSVFNLFGTSSALAGPLQAITNVFSSWWSIIQLVIRAVKVDMDLAWRVMSAGVNLALAQIKALFPPLWEFIIGGFGIVWNMVVEQFVTAWWYGLRRIRAELVNMAGVLNTPEEHAISIAVLRADLAVAQATSQATAMTGVAGLGTTFAAATIVNTPEIIAATAALAALVPMIESAELNAMWATAGEGTATIAEIAAMPSTLNAMWAAAGEGTATAEEAAAAMELMRIGLGAPVPDAPAPNTSDLKEATKDIKDFDAVLFGSVQHQIQMAAHLQAIHGRRGQALMSSAVVAGAAANAARVAGVADIGAAQAGAVRVGAVAVPPVPVPPNVAAANVPTANTQLLMSELVAATDMAIAGFNALTNPAVFADWQDRVNSLDPAARDAVMAAYRAITAAAAVPTIPAGPSPYAPVGGPSGIPAPGVGVPAPNIAPQSDAEEIMVTLLTNMERYLRIMSTPGSGATFTNADFTGV